MHEPVKNGVRQCRLTDRRVPVIDRKLTGYEGGPMPVPIIQQFQQIAAMFVGQRGQPPIIQHHEFRLGKTPEETPIAAIAFGHGQVPEKPWEWQIQGGKPSRQAICANALAE